MIQNSIMSNIGYVFYKDYFKGLDLRKFSENDEKKLVQKRNNTKIKPTKSGGGKNERLLDQTIYKYKPSEQFIKHCLKLYTTYPSLLVGSGYNHEIGIEGEFKLGYYFDYTTGLPCITGSSVKGLLLSKFKHWEYIATIVDDLKSGERKTNLKDDWIKVDWSSILEEDFCNTVFGNQESALSNYKRDIFFDAFPTFEENEDKKLLASDYITPHKHPTNTALDGFANPTPLQFIKVLPNICFQFNFQLVDSDKLLSANLKLDLFKQILLDFGIGAKTNVGYGQFTEKQMVVPTHTGVEKERQGNRNAEIKLENIIKDYSIYKSGDQIEAKVVDIDEGYFFFSVNEDEFVKKEENLINSFEKKKKKREDKGKSSNYQSLKVGDTCTIAIQRDFSLTEQNFSIVPEWS